MMSRSAEIVGRHVKSFSISKEHALVLNEPTGNAAIAHNAPPHSTWQADGATVLLQSILTIALIVPRVVLRTSGFQSHAPAGRLQTLSVLRARPLVGRVIG